ncbi:unnamed protein product [Adineta steineri]|uniref:PiggyBac transposable element-derived protein domain-containing protein n=1 Tax=Adineta steineri TaxID=433720 RepID=A0A815C843_9BILA|nr:unnamed protein product [Adineta steineri]CAF1280097.1 unnamed protein product [Adineta steineri]CAF1487016.1 unnamed protein product [Adineta steineri]CAF3532731.1 unnamed protein product [Adineta steineri]
MTSKTNLKRIREIYLRNDNDDLDNTVSEDDKSSSGSDSDYCGSETESNDTSTDEYISKDDDSSDSYAADNDTNINIQPDTLEKNGVRWTKECNSNHGRLRATNILKKKAGAVTSVNTIVDAFKLFLIDEILDAIILHTNNYARRYYNQLNQKRNAGIYKSKLILWKELDRIELEAFLGLLIQAGAAHMNHRSIDELWDISKNCPLYRATMALKRFQNLLRFIRFDDRLQRNKSDRLAPVRYILESFAKQLPRHFIPGDNVTVDEQLVPFRGRCSFVQYMPGKPSKYGIKFWLLCDVDVRYTLALELYAGKINNVIQRNLSTDVVLRLIDKLSDQVKQGRSVTYDRYFTSFELADGLLERKMTSLGVVNHKRSFVPGELKIIRNNLYSSWFYFSGVHTLLSYQAKQKKPPIILLSTMHNISEVFDDEIKLPVMIHDYNQTKFGVDVMDQCINGYTVRRISKRWPMIVFFNLIDIAAINAMTLWLCKYPNWHNQRKHVRRLFLEELGRSLTNPHNTRRSEQSGHALEVKLALQSLGFVLKPKLLINQVHMENSVKRKRRCYMCPSHPGRKVQQVCDICKYNVCRSHSSSFTSVICHSCAEK